MNVGGRAGGTVRLTYLGRLHLRHAPLHLHLKPLQLRALLRLAVRPLLQVEMQNLKQLYIGI